MRNNRKGMGMGKGVSLLGDPKRAGSYSIILDGRGEFRKTRRLASVRPTRNLVDVREEGSYTAIGDLSGCPSFVFGTV